MLGEKEIQMAGDCLRQALEKGAQKARVSLCESITDIVGTLNGEVDKVSHCMDRSLSVNLFVDGRSGTFSTNRIDNTGDFLDKAIDTVRMLAPDEFRDLPSPERTEKGALAGTELDLYDSDYENFTAEERINLALGASLFANKPEGLISEEAEYSDNFMDSLILDSNGLYCRHTETAAAYGCEMTVMDDEGNRYSGVWWDYASRRSALDVSGVCAEAYRRAVAQMHPEQHGCGKFNLVIDTEVASKVVNPLLNALNAYSIQQNNSFLTGSLGEKVFHEGFTIIDDCRTPGQNGCRLFDSEGVATKVAPIIEGGVVNQYFVNTYMSGKMGIAPTVEEATRPHILGWPRRGMNRDDILALCGSGILVTSFNGGNSNSSTGDFSYGVEGFAFENGKITHPVHEMLITGNFITLWNNLLAAGDDSRLCMSKLIPTLAFSNVDFSA